MSLPNIFQDVILLFVVLRPVKPLGAFQARSFDWSALAGTLLRHAIPRLRACLAALVSGPTLEHFSNDPKRLAEDF